MASASILQRLNQRARQAETMITALKQHIEIIRQNAAITISKPEEERLKSENQKLRVEVEELKSQLMLAEIKNGVKQVPIPINRSVVKSEPPAKEQETKAEVKQAPAATNKQKSEQKPDKKKEKNKPAAAGEPKSKKGKNEPAGEEKMDVSRLDFRVGKIVDVKKHPDADTLYVEEVDLGEDRNRTVVSGLVKHIPLDQMQNKVAVFMCNLKPAKMRGILSEAMIMCASTPEKVEILNVPTGAAIGDRVTCKAFPGNPDAQLNPKKKVWETLAPDLKVNKDRVATFRGEPLQIDGKGMLIAPSLSEVQIK